MTKIQLDALLLEFLIAYIQWVETDENPNDFRDDKGLCSNAKHFQLLKSDNVEDYYKNGVWLLWDHMGDYFTRDFGADNTAEPFGAPEHERDDFRENPRRINWVRKMIVELSDD